MIEPRKRAGSESMMLAGGAALSYDEARTRKVAAEAEIAELELARIRGTLCLTDDVVKAWESVLHACRAKFLAMPSKLAANVAHETDISVIKDVIESQVREALAELANYQPSVDPVATGTVQAAEPDGGEPKPNKKMGRPKKVDKS